jgi:hypothetical protein
LVPFALISVETGKLARGILDLPDAYCYWLRISLQYHFNFRFYLYLRPAFCEHMETLLQRNKHTKHLCDLLCLCIQTVWIGIAWYIVLYCLFLTLITKPGP